MEIPISMGMVAFDSVIFGWHEKYIVDDSIVVNVNIPAQTVPLIPEQSVPEIPVESVPEIPVQSVPLLG